MKNLLLISFLFFSISLFGQLDTVNNGSYAGAGDGEILYTAFEKVNDAIIQLNDSIDIDSVIFNYHSGSLTDGAPTESEINAIIGSPSSKSSGFTARIKDTDGTLLIYYLVTDGVSWYYIVTTEAL